METGDTGRHSGSGSATADTGLELEPMDCRISGVDYDGRGDGSVDGVDIYTYDDLGHLVSIETDDFVDGVIDGVKTYTYDAEGRVASECEADPGGPCQIHLHWTYDVDGRILTESQDGWGTRYITTYTYDAAGNLLREFKDTCCDASLDYAWEYTYDAQGNMLTRVWDYPLDGIADITTIWTYDANGVLLTADYSEPGPCYGDGHEFYSYDARGLLIAQDLWYCVTPGNWTCTGIAYRHDAQDRVIAIDQTRCSLPGTPWAELTYDARGNLTSFMYPAWGDGDQWTYDRRDNVLTWTNLTGGNPNLTRIYHWECFPPS